jgi:LacI family transcriptional regulator
LPKVARLRDVALAAEVSVATVSRFLNGSLSLPPATAKRIERAIRALDYRPNSQARRLSLGRSETIGLVVPEIANPFFAQFADAVEMAAEARGLGVLLCVSRNQLRRELDYLALLQSNHVDGLLFLTNRPGVGKLAKAINTARHVVVVDEDVPGTAVPKIFADNEQGGLLAGQCFLRAGHRALAIVGGPQGMLSTSERRAGFRNAVEAVPAAAVVQEWFCDYSAECGRRIADTVLQARPAPTAVFTTSDVVALGMLERLAERKVVVPRDLSLITFDDVGPLNLFSPPLTAIRQPVTELGTQAVAMLATLIAGNTLPEAEPVRLGVELVARASVAPPRLTEPESFNVKKGALV